MTSTASGCFSSLFVYKSGYSLIYCLNKCLLGTYCILNTLLDAWHTVENKVPCSHGTYILGEEIENKQVIIHKQDTFIQ